MRPIFKILKGAVKGIAESTFIPSVIREVKKTTQSGAKSWLDVNGDGKIDWQDVNDLQWEQIGKLVAVGTIMYLAARFGIPLI
jgi:hypothetical protein